MPVLRWSLGFSAILFSVFLGVSVCLSGDLSSSLPHQSEPSESDLANSGERLLLAMERPGIESLTSNLSRLSHPNQELNVPSELRVMLFVPHPDDETLASGGLVQRVLEKEGTVRVIFMTNGDGFLDGLRCEIKERAVSASDFIEYGKRRHSEALSAISELGLQESDALFFGFPDGGINHLWGMNWSKLQPYTSPFTKLDHPTYMDCFSRWVKYAGTDLKEQILRTLRDFRPDWIIIPDPRDTHPDHCTTGLFVLDALQKLKEEGEDFLVDSQVLTYLVHYLDYPSSTQWMMQINKSGVAGTPVGIGILAQTQWVSFPITSEELAVKERALAAHKSQFGPLNGFLRQFLVHWEMFGRLGSTQAFTLPTEYAAHCGRANLHPSR